MISAWPWPPNWRGSKRARRCVHSCANGLGERTGNAALEELIVALARALRLRDSVQPGQAARVGRIGAAAQRHPQFALNKPILGERNFTRESGIGVDLVVKEPLAMFGTHPALTGRSGEVVLGKKSGKASITYNLEQMGLKDVSDDAVSEMLRRVKQLGETKRGLLNEAEFKEIVDSVLSRRAVAP